MTPPFSVLVMVMVVMMMVVVVMVFHHRSRSRGRSRSAGADRMISRHIVENLGDAFTRALADLVDNAANARHDSRHRIFCFCRLRNDSRSENQTSHQAVSFEAHFYLVKASIYSLIIRDPPSQAKAPTGLRCRTSQSCHWTERIG